MKKRRREEEKKQRRKGEYRKFSKSSECFEVLVLYFLYRSRTCRANMAHVSHSSRPYSGRDFKVKFIKTF